MVNKNEISSKQAKDVFNKSLEEEKSPKDIVEESGMKQNTNLDEIRNIIVEILDNNKENVEKYKNGRTNLLDFFVGQVMKQTRGQANPSITTEILKEELEKR
jgi:aspartyl-tRNA(Asn)/glutamyl-tRNA(Gln) amidotransferase subunit B